MRCVCVGGSAVVGTDGGLIDLIKMKAIDSVMNLQYLIYIIRKAELHLSTDIHGNSAPCSAPTPCTHTHTHTLTLTQWSKGTLNGYQAVKLQHTQVKENMFDFSTVYVHMQHNKAISLVGS